MSRDPFPELPLEAWERSKITLHLFAQVVGKVRLALAPRRNHWWHVPFYVSARGLTTGAIPLVPGNLELELDFTGHRLSVRRSEAEEASIPLEGRSVAQVHDELHRALGESGIRPRTIGKPFDPERVGSSIPFARDHEHADYDPRWVNRFWRILIEVDAVFQEFRGRFVGKCSPVHFFWHSFDLAVTRFSGRRAPVAEDADPVTREAYSHEVISHGFWAGDAAVRAPAFYSYTSPEPTGLAGEPLRPDRARWNGEGSSHMALLMYDDLRAHADPRRALLEFLQSSYEAGAKRARWDRSTLEA